MTPLLAALSLALAAPPATAMELDPAAEQSVHYHVNAKLHRVTGTSKKPEGRARLLPGGDVQAEVRVPVTSFASGNANRDANAMSAVEAQKFPDVVVRGVLHGGATGGGEQKASLQVTFHGVTRELPATLTIERPSPGQAHTTGHFTVKLSDFHVKRPELLFVPIDDDVPIDFDLTWKAVPPA